jgi:hypothetical protein
VQARGQVAPGGEWRRAKIGSASSVRLLTRRSYIPTRVRSSARREGAKSHSVVATRTATQVSAPTPPRVRDRSRAALAMRRATLWNANAIDVPGWRANDRAAHQHVHERSRPWPRSRLLHELHPRDASFSTHRERSGELALVRWARCTRPARHRKASASVARPAGSHWMRRCGRVIGERGGTYFCRFHGDRSPKRNPVECPSHSDESHNEGIARA